MRLGRFLHVNSIVQLFILTMYDVFYDALRFSGRALLSGGVNCYAF